jgi:aspartate 1-decarboxylase
MLRKFLKAKIHGATVTRTDLTYEGSIGIDKALMDAAGILPLESVHVWNSTNGTRLETYAITSEAGSGEICLNGAAARLAMPGDIVIIASYCWIEESRLPAHEARVVAVDDKNRPVKTSIKRPA